MGTKRDAKSGDKRLPAPEVVVEMPDTPLTPRSREPEPGISFLVSDEEFEATARSQRAYFEDLAERILRGDATLTVLDGIWAAGAIRAFASQIPLKPPGRRGRAPTVDPGEVALEFALLVTRRGYSKNRAFEHLAGKWDVSVTAIKKAWAKDGPTALSWLQNLSEK